MNIYKYRSKLCDPFKSNIICRAHCTLLTKKGFRMLKRYNTISLLYCFRLRSFYLEFYFSFRHFGKVKENSLPNGTR